VLLCMPPCIEDGGARGGRFEDIFGRNLHATALEEPPGDATWKGEAVPACRGAGAPWVLHPGAAFP
jgi:hypothetical protein